jgi:hypothetical protein
MDIISAGIIGLIFILLIVFAVMSRKTWHWVNIVFLILTFMAGVGASIGLSQVFKLRNEQLKDAQTYEQLAEQNETAANQAIYGSPDSINYEADSLRGAEHNLSLAMIGRGRVWSNGQVTVEDAVRDFKFATPRPADSPTQLEGVLLYAFADGTINDQPYPLTYIGSVLVGTESPESLKLQPEFISNFQEWNEPSASWTLFEKMPLDRHDTFKQGIVAYVDSTPDAPEPLKQIADSIRNDEMAISRYRDALKANYLQPELVNLNEASPEYEKLIDRYAFDGMSLGKIQNWIEANPEGRISQRFQPAPEEVFVRFKFNKESTRPYTVDADGSLETDGPFTPLGQAVQPALHAGKDVEFAEGETVLVDQRTAEGYQRGPDDQVPAFSQVEDVTEMDRIYVRQLNDFPYLLAELTTQTVNMSEEVDRVRQNNVVQDKALADADAQLQDRLKTTAGLEQDNTNLKNDLDTIQAMWVKLQEENRDFLARIESLKNQIQQSYQRIQDNAREAERQAFAGG